MSLTLRFCLQGAKQWIDTNNEQSPANGEANNDDSDNGIATSKLGRRVLGQDSTGPFFRVRHARLHRYVTENL